MTAQFYRNRVYGLLEQPRKIMQNHNVSEDNTPVEATNTAAPTAKANKLTYHGIMRDLARQKVEGFKILRKFAQGTDCVEDSETLATNSNLSLDANEHAKEISLGISVPTINISSANLTSLAKADESEAILALMELVRYVVMLAGKTFDLFKISQLLRYWFEPRYDAAVQFLGGNEFAERMLLILLSEHLDQPGLARKVGRKLSFDFNADEKMCDCFEIDMPQDSNGLDYPMLPLEDALHLLKRQREEREEVDRLMETVRQNKANLSTPRDSSISNPLDDADSHDPVDQSETGEQ